MKYTVKYGDSLRMIAQNELGDAERWSEIAEINRLSYPYISESVRKGVATPGDTIIVPVEEYEGYAEDPTFGTDMFLTSDRINMSFGRGGDLLVGADGDYLLISELDCLRQDLSHRKMTPLGTLPYHPSYGSLLADIVGSKKDSNWRTKAILETERTLRCDPRISDVSNLTVESLPTGMSIKYTAVAKGLKFDVGGIE